MLKDLLKKLQGDDSEQKDGSDAQEKSGGQGDAEQLKAVWQTPGFDKFQFDKQMGKIKDLYVGIDEYTQPIKDVDVELPEEDLTLAGSTRPPHAARSPGWSDPPAVRAQARGLQIKIPDPWRKKRGRTSRIPGSKRKAGILAAHRSRT